MKRVDASLAIHRPDSAALAGGRTFAEEAVVAIQRLVAVANAYAEDLRQRGFAFEVTDRSPTMEVSFVGRTGNWSLTLGEHSDAPEKLAFITSSPPYTRELDPGFWIPAEISDEVFESKLEVFIAKVVNAELHPE